MADQTLDIPISGIDCAESRPNVSPISLIVSTVWTNPVHVKAAAETASV
jgi:hypothetical protein